MQAQGRIIRTVQVGRNGSDLSLTFTPEITRAAVGDLIQFQFYPVNHSVQHGSFDSPCAPMPVGPKTFFSGFRPVSRNAPLLPTFTIQVMSKDPIFFYCSQSAHCIDGFAGVINPNSTHTLERYKARARALRPGSGTGGVDTVVGESGRTTTSTTPTVAPTMTSTMVPAPAESDAANESPSERVQNVGVIVGAILGGVAALVIGVVGIGVFLVRRKKAKRRIGLGPGRVEEKRGGGWGFGSAPKSGRQFAV
ncbi:hypothetical protein BJ508DRAFT_210619 [Ascobolus immersus RN42]|uniref:Cupredoxin n=1 Tax=Ascobolus immersus RN42 TaxID=1160509 RepID=A0A3N4I1R4_ASCIM|nr:hypothetical protein BJ508DRAFT_210619 [Ascobolus immersus RN42]